MNTQHYTLVLGASGNLGGKVLQELLKRGEKVAAIVRNREKLHEFEGQIEILEGDFHDDRFLQSAFSQAKALFCTIPDAALGSPETAAERLIPILEASPIQHIVNISNATLKRNGGYTALIRFERALSKLKGIALKHLRCANFFENLNWGIHTPYLPDLRLPYISSYEIAHVAANYLQHKNFDGVSTVELLGERDYSMSELAAHVGISYTQLPYSDENIGFYQPFNEGNFELVTRTDQNTSSPAEERFTLDYFIRHDLKL
ncbi:NAD(P)H-binding protein [uncultured Pontibacter sp.]|uniref:NAD(P)H-binding protein n=1 Tax=uncultured Pontibacter sp. TaxID=453356 RepID=UPI002626F7F8|nr:NAD(P)H-binding protein [uncultured Pontibacter sp.]